MTVHVYGKPLQGSHMWPNVSITLRWLSVWSSVALKLVFINHGSQNVLGRKKYKLRNFGIGGESNNHDVIDYWHETNLDYHAKVFILI